VCVVGDAAGHLDDRLSALILTLQKFSSDGSSDAKPSIDELWRMREEHPDAVVDIDARIGTVQLPPTIGDSACDRALRTCNHWLRSLSRSCMLWVVGTATLPRVIRDVISARFAVNRVRKDKTFPEYVACAYRDWRRACRSFVHDVFRAE
jgi:hypothetical protein